MGLFRTSDSIISQTMPLTAAMIASIDSRPAWVFQNQSGTLGTNLNSSVIYCGAMVTDSTISVILSGTSLDSVATLALTFGGTGYTAAVGVATTCSNPNASGLTVNTTVGGGVITGIVVNAVGAGYNPGDIITIAGGGANATAAISTVAIGAPVASQAITFAGLQPGSILPVAVDYVTAVGGTDISVADFIVGR